MLNSSICHISKSFSEIFETDLLSLFKNNTVKILCFSDLQFACVGRLHVASLDVKIERICFSVVNTGLSE